MTARSVKNIYDSMRLNGNLSFMKAFLIEFEIDAN